MKITVKEIDEKIAAANAERERLKAESRETDKKKAELESMATAAAEAGELENYRALKRQAANLEEESFVRTAQMKKLSDPANEEEVFSAWRGYVDAFNKALKSRLIEAEKKMNAFLDEYEAAINLQTEALIVRERLAGYLGKEYAEKPEGKGFVMDYIPTEPVRERAPVNDAVAAFYLSQRKATREPGSLYMDPVTSKVASVVINHRSK